MRGTAVMAVDAQIREKIAAIVAGEVLFDEPMSAHTSMGVGGKTDALAFPHTVDTLKTLLSCIIEEEVPFLPIGNGTNLIVRDGGYRGVLISLERLRTLEVAGRDDNGGVRVHAEAGVSCASIVDFSVRESLTGMEFCAGIPGSIGGGLKMNAGAWGREMKDVVTSIFLLNGMAKEREIPRDDLLFAYRNLTLPDGAIITGADFHLQRGEGESIRERIEQIISTRKARHPLAYRSAGSVFKNPPVCPAGKLIEEAGLKGFRIGGAEVSEKHGNFIVNRGGATASDIVALIGVIQSKVRDERNISFELELKIIGDEA